MFNKLIFFVGTYEELTKWLNERGYFVDENRKKLFFENVGERSQFGPFWIDEKINPFVREKAWAIHLITHLLTQIASCSR